MKTLLNMFFILLILIKITKYIMSINEISEIKIDEIEKKIENNNNFDLNFENFEIFFFFSKNFSIKLMKKTIEKNIELIKKKIIDDLINDRDRLI